MTFRLFDTFNSLLPSPFSFSVQPSGQSLVLTQSGADEIWPYAGQRPQPARRTIKQQSADRVHGHLSTCIAGSSFRRVLAEFVTIPSRVRWAREVSIKAPFREFLPLPQPGLAWQRSCSLLTGESQ